MSSHREAPAISKDPVADNTDVYAFVSPDKPATVTLIANFIPLQKPDSGPNFWEFADDVLYEIHVCNRGDAVPDVTYQFRFTHDDPQQAYLPLQHRPDHLDHRRCLEPPADLLGDPRRPGRQRAAAGGEPDRPAGQHRAAQHAELRGSRERGRPPHRRRSHSVRRAACRRLLRRPRLASSTSARCARSSTCTSSRRRTRWASTAPQATNVHTLAIQVPKADLARGGTVTNNPADRGRGHRCVRVREPAARARHRQ